MIRLQVDRGTFDTLINVLNAAGKRADMGIRKAVNETAQKTRKDLCSKTKENYTIKRDHLKLSHFKVRKATTGSLMAEINISGRPTNLRKFKSQKNTKTMAARAVVRTDSGGMKLLEKDGIKAFVRKVGGNELILQRKGRSRNPIKGLMGPGRNQMAERVYEDIQTDVSAELKRQIELVIIKTMGGRR